MKLIGGPSWKYSGPLAEVGGETGCNHIVGEHGERIDTGCLAWPAIRAGETPALPVPKQHVYLPGDQELQDLVDAAVESLLRDATPQMRKVLENLGSLTPAQIKDLKQHVWEALTSFS